MSHHPSATHSTDASDPSIESVTEATPDTPPPGKRWVTTKQAAEILGCTQNTVRVRYHRGALVGREFVRPQGSEFQVLVDDPEASANPSDIQALAEASTIPPVALQVFTATVSPLVVRHEELARLVVLAERDQEDLRRRLAVAEGERDELRAQLDLLRRPGVWARGWAWLSEHLDGPRPLAAHATEDLVGPERRAQVPEAPERPEAAAGAGPTEAGRGRHDVPGPAPLAAPEEEPLVVHRAP